MSASPGRALRSAWLHVLLPLGAGGALYVLARPSSLRLFLWLEAMGLSASVASARDAMHSRVLTLPAWIRFSLPNALWVYAFTWLLSALWDHRTTRASTPWLLLAPILGVGWELGQLAGVVPGTFDLVDLALTLVAGALALLKPLALLPTPNVR